MFITPSGIIILVRLEHLLNIPEEMFVNPSDRVTLARYCYARQGETTIESPIAHARHTFREGGGLASYNQFVARGLDDGIAVIPRVVNGIALGNANTCQSRTFIKDLPVNVRHS